MTDWRSRHTGWPTTSAQAGDNEKALEYSVMAGDAAARLYAHQEANSHYTRALELINMVTASREQRIDVYIARGRTLELLGDFDEALANYQQLQSFAQDQKDRTLETGGVDTPGNGPFDF